MANDETKHALYKEMVSFLDAVHLSHYAQPHSSLQGVCL